MQVNMMLNKLSLFRKIEYYLIKLTKTYIIILSKLTKLTKIWQK
jgi:hypothetical protein